MDPANPPSAQWNQIPGERRFNRRYPIALDVQWTVIWRRRIVDKGTGTTVDLSSGGILFCPGKPLPEGHQVNLSIRWPVFVQDYPPIQLAVSGVIVRSAQNNAAIRMIQHEFRTVARVIDRLPGGGSSVREGGE